MSTCVQLGSHQDTGKINAIWLIATNTLIEVVFKPLSVLNNKPEKIAVQGALEYCSMHNLRDTACYEVPWACMHVMEVPCDY